MRSEELCERSLRKAGPGQSPRVCLVLPQISLESKGKFLQLFNLTDILISYNPQAIGGSYGFNRSAKCNPV